MKKMACLLATSILFTGCFNSKEKISIEPIKAIDFITIHTENGDTTGYRFDNYKVKNYNDDNLSKRIIDTFEKKNLPSVVSKYTNYKMIFFKAVDDTDTIMLRDHPDRFYNMENQLCEYVYFKGKLVQISRFDDGKQSIVWDSR